MFGAVHCGLGEEWPGKAMWLGLAKEHPWSGGHSLQYLFAEDRTPKPACEKELWVQVLLICSQVACTLSVIVFSLYVWANKGSSVLSPEGSLLGRMCADWSMWCHYLVAKEVLTCNCNTVAYVRFGLWEKVVRGQFPGFLNHYATGTDPSTATQVG